MQANSHMVAALAWSGAALTGCTVYTAPGPDASNAPESSSPAVTSSAQTPLLEPRGNVTPVITGVWAGVKYDQFLETAGDTCSGECGDASTPAGLRVCAPFEPFAYVCAVESPAPGYLLVTITPEAWGGGAYDPEQFFTLQYVGDAMSQYMAVHDDDLKALTVTTPAGSHTFTQEWQPHYASVRGS